MLDNFRIDRQLNAVDRKLARAARKANKPERGFFSWAGHYGTPFWVWLSIGGCGIVLIFVLSILLTFFAQHFIAGLWILLGLIACTPFYFLHKAYLMWRES